jgi:hypothetical protein
MSNWVFDSPFGGVSADNEGDFFIYKPLTKTTLSSSIPKETHINNNNIQPIKAWKFHNSSKSIEAQVLIEVSKNSSSRKNSLPPHKSIYLSYKTHNTQHTHDTHDTHDTRHDRQGRRT